MRIAIKNFRGCEAADFEISKVALVCGNNEAGKTSIAQAVASALTANASPIDGIAKNAAGRLLRDGASRGSCRVWSDTGFSQANWPGASVSSDGNKPQASRIAVGLDSIVDMSTANRSALLINVMDALPNKEQLSSALGGLVPGPTVDAVWSFIASDGWDAAHKRSKAKGAELKGAWSHVAGETWGKVKGESWRPAGLPDGVTIAAAEKIESERRQLLEDAISNKAADGARREMLKTAAAVEMPNLGDLSADYHAAESKMEKAKADLDALPQPFFVAGGDCPCPHCGEDLLVISKTDVRVVPEGLSDAENKKRKIAIEKQTAVLKELKNKHTAASDLLQSAKREVVKIKAAADELAALPAGSVSAADIAAIRADVDSAVSVVSFAKNYAAAKTLHAQINQNAALADQLAPGGLRLQILTEKLAAFNKTLADFSAIGGWPAVSVGDDLSVRYGCRDYILLSASAQFRTRLTIQLAIASMDGSDLVVIDAADILDKKGRNGLFSLVVKTGLKCLILMTFDAPSLVPDLSKPGFGSSFWVGDGVLAPL